MSTGNRTASRAVWWIWGFLVFLALATSVLSFLGRSTQDPTDAGFFIFAAVVGAGAFAPVGALIVARRGNAVGWTLLAIGAGFVLTMFASSYAVAATAGVEWLPAWRYVAWIGMWSWLPTAGAVPLLLLLFPTGRLPSRRWRPVVWIGAAGIAVATIATALNPIEFEITAGVPLDNPFGLRGWGNNLSRVIGATAAVIFPAALLAVASLFLRYRRGSSDQREQIKWLAYVALADVAIFVIGMVVSGVCKACDEGGFGDVAFGVFFAVLALGIPAAVGAAILRHGLYDIDVIINKTVLYVLLAGFFTVVYVAIVVGIGTAVGNRSNAFLTMLAAVTAAVAFQPVRQRAARLANRLVYGKRATPYEVLSEFSDRMAVTVSTEDVLPRMARILGEGTGARRAEVWLRLGPELQRAAVWPPDAEDAPGRVALPGDELSDLAADLTAPVRHQGELLGALAVTMPPGEAATSVTEKLLADLAAQAGLVLRNVRLIEELRASRKRLVAAQDQERRRLERNLHDGAQQQLVALKVRLGLAKATAEKDPSATRAMLDQLEGATQEALDELRDLARGIYPPVLADQGLPAALQAQARKSALPVRIESDGIGRYDQEAEAAVYFCCLEALQNVAKYAEASGASIKLWTEDGSLAFSVRDDGHGFDPSVSRYGTGLQGMADRLAALGGGLEVRSAPGEGTTVAGRVPATPSTTK
ncbi:MAG: histidine kinase [Actinomycetota bacterium]